MPKLTKLKLVHTIGTSDLRTDGPIRALACGPGVIVSTGDDAGVRVFDSKTGKLLRRLAIEEGAYSVAVSADGKSIAAGGHTVNLWAGKKETLLPCKPLVFAVAFSADGKKLLVGDDRVPRQYDVATGKLIGALNAHQSRVQAVAFSPDGRLALSSGDNDSKLKLHDLSQKKPMVLATWKANARSCGFSPDGRFAWSTGWGHATLWSMETREELRTFEISYGGIGALSPDGSRLAVKAETEVELFDTSTGKKMGAVPFVQCNALAFSADGKQLCLGTNGRDSGEGHAIEVFDLATSTRVMPRDDGHLGQVSAVAISDKMLVSLGVDGLLQLTDLKSGRALERYGPTKTQGVALALTPDGAQAVVATDDETAVWNLSTGTAKPIAKVRGTTSIAVSPDGASLLCTQYQPRVPLLIEVRSCKQLQALTGHSKQHRLGDVRFSVDGETLLTSSGDGEVIGWSRKDGKQRFTINCGGTVEAIVVVPGTKFLVTASRGQLLAWDLETRHQDTGPIELGTKGRRLRALAATPDGRLVALRTSEDWTSSLIELWALKGKEPAIEASADLTPLGTSGTSITASPDGKLLCVGCCDGRMLVFSR